MSTSSSANQAGMASVGAGAATGAAIGSVIPGIGTLAGAAIGSAIGGIAGSIGLGNKAKKNAKRAKRLQQERERNAEADTYLQMIREARQARAGSLAYSTAYGLASSSLATSAMSSIGSQSQYSVQYLANDQRLVKKINNYLKKAATYAKASQTTLATGQLASMAFGVGAAASAAAGTAAGAATGAGNTLASGGSMEAAGLGIGADWGAIGASGSTVAGANAVYNSAYATAFSNNLMQLGMWQSVASPIYQGIQQYNQY